MVKIENKEFEWNVDEIDVATAFLKSGTNGKKYYICANGWFYPNNIYENKMFNTFEEALEELEMTKEQYFQQKEKKQTSEDFWNFEIVEKDFNNIVTALCKKITQLEKNKASILKERDEALKNYQELKKENCRQGLEMVKKLIEKEIKELT